MLLDSTAFMCLVCHGYPESFLASRQLSTTVTTSEHCTVVFCCGGSCLALGGRVFGVKVVDF